MRSHLLTPLFLLFAAYFVLGSGTAAQAPGAAQRFAVESIAVGGVLSDAAREIVTAQSLLVPGREYTEEEIRHAVYRIKRLPFVLDAELTLRAGKAPGSTEVVVGVVSTRALFASAEVTGAWNGDARAGDDRTDWGVAANLGGRLFVGRRGLASGSVQGFDGVGPALARAGYTQYGLFGRGAAASVELAANVDRDQADTYDGTVRLDLPLTGDHSLRADLNWFQATRDEPLFHSRSVSWALGLAWLYDTTDDPLFPTLGSRLAGGARYSDSEQSYRGSDFPFEDSSHGYGLDLAGRRHWALNERQSVSTELAGSWDRATSGSLPGHREEARATLGFGHAADLRRRGGPERLADFRWESSVKLLSTRSDSSFGRETSTDASLSTGLALRNAWGLVRLTLSYVDNLDRNQRVDGGSI